MDTRQQVLDKAVAAGDAPFLVAMTADAAGVTWTGISGDAAPGRPAGPDTVHRIFSMTKGVGSTAAMMLVDRGKIGMDDPVDRYLPQAADLKVVVGFDDDGPQFRAPASIPTIRQLATHTSGLVYEFTSAEVGRHLEESGHPSVLSGLKASIQYPLAFDPGERWQYGIGIDWLGLVVEAVDGRSIDRFLKEELLGPLGMTDTSCVVEDHMAPRLAVSKARGEDGKLVDFRMDPPADPEFFGMGHALYSTPADYLTFTRLFLNRGTMNGHRILSEDAVDRMLANSIGDLRVGRFESLAPALLVSHEFFPGTPKTHSFGFLRVEEDVPGMRHAGSQGWAGVLNSHYWFDPTAGISGVIMTQALPFADPRFLATYTAFERAVYAEMT